MWSSLSVTCDMSVVFSGSSRFLHQYNWPPRYNWNIVESGVKHHQTNKRHVYLCLCYKFGFQTALDLYMRWIKLKMSIVHQKSSLGRISLTRAGRNFIKKIKENTHQIKIHNFNVGLLWSPLFFETIRTATHLLLCSRNAYFKGIKCGKKLHIQINYNK
jgi:hypothetical protein